MKKKYLFIIAFSLIAFSAISQIDLRNVAASLNLTSVMTNKPDKMFLYGLDKNKVLSSTTNSYYYHSTLGFNETTTYLDKNSISIYRSKTGFLYVIYNTGTKKNLVSYRNCYNSIEVDPNTKKAVFKDLFEEDKMVLDTLNCIQVLKQKGLDKNNLMTCTEVFININPVLYFFTTYYEIPRNTINSSKYSFNIELVTATNFIDLYKMLSPDMISNKLNSDILTNLNQSLKNEIAKISDLKPKGEFETTDQYNARTKTGEEQKTRIEENYQKIINEFKPLADKFASETVQNSVEDITLSVEEIGSYNADKQLFPVTINGVTKDVMIPLQQAKDFKEKKATIKVLAEKKISEDGTSFTLLNIRIVNPITGEVIIF